jgi:hypothetical protein
MRKNYFSVIALLAMLSVSFSSCKDEGNDNPKPTTTTTGSTTSGTTSGSTTSSTTGGTTGAAPNGTFVLGTETFSNATVTCGPSGGNYQVKGVSGTTSCYIYVAGTTAPTVAKSYYLANDPSSLTPSTACVIISKQSGGGNKIFTSKGAGSKLFVNVSGGKPEFAFNNITVEDAALVPSLATGTLKCP